MKKFIALLLALVMVMSLAACSVEKTEEPAATQAPAAPAETQAAEAPAAPAAATEISLWTYPIGGWGNQATVDALLADFEAETGIKVTVEYLNYTDGDDKVNTAIEAGAAPDLIMEGPERLVANWGEKGLMVDLSDILVAEDVAELNPAALAACYGTDGAIYEYPLVMTAHCMAINKTVFEAAGAMQYLNEETHTWNSVADFLAAVDAVYAHTGSQVGAVFCGGQGGDQGTRALVNNLNGGTFTNAEHTAYTWDSAENVAALQTLVDCEGIEFDAGIVGGDEIALFYNGTLNMAFCWNIAQQLDPNTAGTGSEKTASGDD
ncbi:MAG: extracellular solute-binding protein, partial [Oscillospiraceae bacterium]|nr:extracellular solute-binding protein [Oscillospiraceae bacterium]